MVLAGVDEQLLVLGAQPAETAAALTNCGRLPMTVRMRMAIGRGGLGRGRQLTLDALAQRGGRPGGQRPSGFQPALLHAR